MLQLNLHPFTSLDTDRLLLRQLTADDAHDLFILRSNKKVIENLLKRPLSESIDEARQLIQKVNNTFETHDGITWGITLRDNPKAVIGTVGFWRMTKEHHRAEIGYMLHPDFHGKGIMQEAVNTVIRYGFDAMKLHSIEANVNPDNAASIKLLERSNFAREGYFKENFYSNGVFLDSVVYSLVNSAQQQNG